MLTDIWNDFCHDVAASKRKKSKEIDFERGPVKDFLTSLGWTKYGNCRLVEQYPIVFATSSHFADFALFLSDADKPEMIIELKRPVNKKRDKDTTQLEDYMVKKECCFGLLVGEKVELYFIDYSKPRHLPQLILSIDFTNNNQDALHLMELMVKDSYDSDNMRAFCLEQVKLDNVANYWKSEDGIAELYSYMINKSSLSDAMKNRFRSVISLDVKIKNTHIQETKQEDITDNPWLAADRGQSLQESSIFHAFKINVKDVEATINYYPSEYRFVVVAGSKVRKEPTNSFDNKTAIAKREEVFADKTLSIPQGESVLLLKDIEFKVAAPNIPVQFCTAKSTNATKALVDSEGKTFAELFPKDHKTGVDIQPKEIFTPPTTDSDFLGCYASKLIQAVEVPLIKKGRSVYTTADGKVGYVIRTSKMYPQGQREKYWFAYRRNKDIKNCQQQFFVYGCKDENTVVVLPVSDIEHQLEGLNNTKDANGNPIYWHIVFLKDQNDRMTWLISKPTVHEIDITNKLLK